MQDLPAHIRNLPRGVFRLWSRHAPLFTELSREVLPLLSNASSPQPSPILDFGGPLDPATMTGLTLLVCSYVENSQALDPMLYALDNNSHAIVLPSVKTPQIVDDAARAIAAVLNNPWDNTRSVAAAVMNALAALNSLGPRTLKSYPSEAVLKHGILERLMVLLREDHCQDVVNQVVTFPFPPLLLPLPLTPPLLQPLLLAPLISNRGVVEVPRLCAMRTFAAQTYFCCDYYTFSRYFYYIIIFDSFLFFSYPQRSFLCCKRWRWTRR